MARVRIYTIVVYGYEYGEQYSLRKPPVIDLVLTPISPLFVTPRYEELGTTLSYCTKDAPNSGNGGGTSTSTKWQVFGASGTSTWQCDLSTLVDQDQYFYDLYYEDRSGDLYPVPVRLTQYSESGAFPNEVSEDSAPFHM